MKGGGGGSGGAGGGKGGDKVRKVRNKRIVGDMKGGKEGNVFVRGGEKHGELHK